MSHAEDLETIEQALRFCKLGFYKPYPKQAEFHCLGATHDERAMIAGNQVGKTMCACSEDAMHLTGDYPPWWEGHRFNKPIAAWMAGPTSEKVRDVPQTLLFGHYAKPDEFGTGYIPKEALVGRPSLSRGVTFAYDTASIKCKIKGKLDESAISTLTFKAYTEGQLAFASDTIDLYHGDEESDLDLYIEARTRLQVKHGISYLTLTPLLGWTTLVNRFLRESAPNRASVKMGLYDALHYSREDADKIIAGFPTHLRDAKAFGDPALGEGRVFLTDEAELLVPRFDSIPPFFKKIWGVDFGGAGSGSHPFAAALLAFDEDNDLTFLLHSMKMQGMTKLQHIPAIRRRGARVPVAWPHDGNELRDGPNGTQQLAEQYRHPMPGMPGLEMLPKHATWPQGGFSTNAAVDMLNDMTKTGRFKVVEGENAHFLDEYRQYHRDDHKLVKVNDDILSAVFKALMMRRYALPVGLGDATGSRQRQGGMTEDFNVHTGAAVPRS